MTTSSPPRQWDAAADRSAESRKLSALVAAAFRLVLGFVASVAFTRFSRS